MSYDRYNMFRVNGDTLKVPFIPIPIKGSDYYETYEKGKTRLDILSYQYYKNPDYAWLIMQANPQYGSIEYLIPDKAQIRIPYPLNTTLTMYEEDIENYKKFNTVD
jgi:hypothetical protein